MPLVSQITLLSMELEGALKSGRELGQFYSFRFGSGKKCWKRNPSNEWPKTFNGFRAAQLNPHYSIPHSTSSVVCLFCAALNSHQEEKKPFWHVALWRQNWLATFQSIIVSSCWRGGQYPEAGLCCDWKNKSSPPNQSSWEPEWVSTTRTKHRVTLN